MPRRWMGVSTGQVGGAMHSQTILDPRHEVSNAIQWNNGTYLGCWVWARHRSKTTLRKETPLTHTLPLTRSHSPRVAKASLYGWSSRGVCISKELQPGVCCRYGICGRLFIRLGSPLRLRPAGCFSRDLPGLGDQAGQCYGTRQWKHPDLWTI